VIEEVTTATALVTLMTRFISTAYDDAIRARELDKWDVGDGPITSSLAILQLDPSALTMVLFPPNRPPRAAFIRRDVPEELAASAAEFLVEGLERLQPEMSTRVHAALTRGAQLVVLLDPIAVQVQGALQLPDGGAVPLFSFGEHVAN